ncbi:MAG TPA: hypothetical protein VL098_10555 [Flavipsychrobacter sp.]|nr:hypothetical protein [Flavipsychrobacter sp.]
MQKIFLFLTLFFINLNSGSAQHFLDGTWEGNYSKTFLMTQPRKIVVNIDVKDDTVVTGTSHLYYNNDHYEHYAVNGLYNPEDSTIYFSEDSTIAVNLGAFASNCLGDYNMKLKVTDSLFSFKGKWSDNSSSFLGCPTTGVWLVKPIKKNRALPKDQNLQRKEAVQKLIELDAGERDSIKIELMDNAEIDGDVVSVYVNDSAVLYKQRLAAQPLIFYVSIPAGMSIYNLKMAAESMGSIAPCTAAMTVSTKKHRYTLYLSSSMNSNSVVQFFLKE